MSIIVNGVEYKNLNRACKEIGVSYSKVYNYISRNSLSVDEAFKLAKKDSSIVIGGIKYESIKSACDTLNLDSNKVYARLSLGWSLDEALEVVDRDKKSKVFPIIVNGIKYRSLNSACFRLGVKPKTVENFLHQGYNIEEAFEKSKGEVNFEGLSITKNFKVNGKVYKNLKTACKDIGVDYSKVWSRLKAGWSVDEAFGFAYRDSNPGGNRSNKTVVNGMFFSSFKEACEFYGVNHHTARSRVASGKSLEEALNIKK